MAPFEGSERRLRSWAVNGLLVVLALYVAVQLIVSAAPALLVIGTVGTTIYVGVLVIRHRRTHW